MAPLLALVSNEKADRNNTCQQSSFRDSDWLLFII